MVVKISQTVKSYIEYDTGSHRFKINEDVLDKLRAEKAWSLLKTKIQKGMKLVVDDSSGTDWDENWRLIFEEIQNGSHNKDENRAE